MSAVQSTVGRLLHERIDQRYKGFPLASPPLTLDQIGRQGWSLRAGDLPLPLLVAKRRALDHNIERMQRYCREHGVQLAPHGKTTMSPQMFERQVTAGAWGLTVATVEQLGIYLEFGFPRLLLANQVAGSANVNALGAALKSSGAEIYLFVDSARGVEDLDAMAEAWQLAQPIMVLLEVGGAGMRTGTRTAPDVARILAALDGAKRVRLAGVATYEGLLPTSDDRNDERVRALLAHTARVIDDLRAARRLPDAFLVTAGGSGAFDLVVDAFAGRWPGATVVLRSGCYVTHDHGLYAASSGLRGDSDPFQPALEVWGYIQSLPEAGLAYATFGRRDVPFDAGFPIPIARISRENTAQREPVESMSVEALNDQHARIRYADDDLAVGDIVIFGISHPCGAFDRWRMLYVIDDDDVVVDALLTFF